MATRAETTATGERLKECQRSLSRKRPTPSPRRAAALAAPSRLPSCRAISLFLRVADRHGLFSAPAGIDHVVPPVDDEVDDDEEETDQHAVGGHHGDTDLRYRLDEQQAHAWPLEHRPGDEADGDDGAEQIGRAHV